MFCDILSHMNAHQFDDTTFLFRIAAWIWLGYLALLLATDLALSATPLPMLGRYYLVNGLVALLFLAGALWPGLQQQPGGV